MPTDRNQEQDAEAQSQAVSKARILANSKMNHPLAMGDLLLETDSLT